MDHPLKFPNGELILSLVPQLVIAPYGVDKVRCRKTCIIAYYAIVNTTALSIIVNTIHLFRIFGHKAINLS